MSNPALQMDLADCGSPEGLAQIIHTHVPLQDNGCADLIKIALAVGIKTIKATDTEKYEGVLITDEQKSTGTILYNTNSSVFKKRFTIAHEIGHFLLPFHDKNTQCLSTNIGTFQATTPQLKKEAEANRFAIELLAPYKAVSSFLKSYRKPDLDQVLKIAARFKLSKEAALRRYIECTDHDVGAVLAQNETVRYPLKTRDFPYLCLKKGSFLPPHIYQKLKGKTSGNIIDWFSVEPSYFLSEQQEVGRKELYCQTLVQDKAFSISLLSIEW